MSRPFAIYTLFEYKTKAFEQNVTMIYNEMVMLSFSPSNIFIYRLIVVAGKEVVQRCDSIVTRNTLPMALNNRLEKHILFTATMLSEEQKAIVKDLENWVERFSSITLPQHSGMNADRFVFDM